MLEVAVAKEWGLTPSQFKQLSSEDQASMIAFEEVTSEISSAESFIAEEKARKANRKKTR